MGFWDVIERVVGCIPVLATVKNAIEAGIEEARGHHAEAKEKVLQAGFDIVNDIVTVEILGTGVEVAIAGKMAAEEALKQAEKGALKTAAEATSLGLGKNAAVVVTVAAAARVARRKASEKKNQPFKPTSTVPTKPPEKQKEPSSNDTTATPAPASPWPRPKIPKKDPIQGHHVINKGVKKIFHDIIKKIFEEFKEKIFLGYTYEDLYNEEIINENDTPTLMRSRYPPLPPDVLPPDVLAQIEAMVAYTPSGETYIDENAAIFGVAKLMLVNAVSKMILDVFTSLNKMPDSSGEFGPDMSFVTDLIAAITEEPTGGNGVYVDNQALQWWLASGGQDKEDQFIMCRDIVRHMFNSLADVSEPPEQWIACISGREIFKVHRKLIEKHNKSTVPLPYKSTTIQ